MRSPRFLVSLLLLLLLNPFLIFFHCSTVDPPQFPDPTRRPHVCPATLPTNNRAEAPSTPVLWDFIPPVPHSPDLRRSSSFSILQASQSDTISERSSPPPRLVPPNTQSPPISSHVFWQESPAHCIYTPDQQPKRVGEAAAARAQREERNRHIAEASRKLPRLEDVIDLCNSKHTTVHSVWAPGLSLLLVALGNLTRLC